MIKSLGLPNIHKEEGEKRAFLPQLVKELVRYDVDVYLERGYGSKMGFRPEDYLAANPRVRFVSMEETFKQDLILVLRAPNFDELELMRPGSSLVAMLHYESRPVLLEKLRELGIQPFSIDSIADDLGRRMVVNYRGTAWGGLKTAFAELSKVKKDFFDPEREPLRASIIGMGNLGIEAARGCFRYGDEALYEKAQALGLPGVVVEFLEVDVTRNRRNLSRILESTDLLVDATRRPDYSQVIVPNELLSCLKEEAVILDLAADPYDIAANPVNVKAIEGIPYGTLDQYVFYPGDEAYGRIPREVPSDNRRIAVSCNAWPGVLPVETMEVYGQQLKPFLNVLLTKERELFTEESDNLAERALCRAVPPKN